MGGSVGGWVGGWVGVGGGVGGWVGVGGGVRVRVHDVCFACVCLSSPKNTMSKKPYKPETLQTLEAPYFIRAFSTKPL